MVRDKTFITISNQEIYKELCNLKLNNDTQHQQIISMITKYEDNLGRMRWGLGGAYTLLILTMGWLVSHLMK